MDILPPDDGLQGLAPFEPRPIAGLMPNAAHQAAHGFMTGAPYELAIVGCGDGAVEILQVQRPSRSIVSGRELMRGARLSPGVVFERSRAP